MINSIEYFFRCDHLCLLKPSIIIPDYPAHTVEVFVRIAKDWVHNCIGTYRKGESYTFAKTTLLWILNVQSYIQHFICTENQGEVGIKK